MISQAGKEAALVVLVEKQPQIMTAFERSAFLPGYIYVEAHNLADIVSAITGMAGISINQSIPRIPDMERPSLHCLGTNTKLGFWVRVGGKGKYRDDWAYLSMVNQKKQQAVVLVIPLISLDGNESIKGKRKLVPRTRPLPHPSPSVFSPEAKRNIESLGPGRVKFHKQVFQNGLLELIFPVSKLRDARPSVAELELFTQSGAIHDSIMTKAFSDIAAAAVVPGHRVRITSGEQAGMVGTVLKVDDEAVRCESGTGTVEHVPVSSVRLHLDVGDYVQVHVRKHAGKHGGVIKVERASDQDVVSFIDDMSLKSGPEEVRSELVFVILAHQLFLQIKLSAFFVRVCDRSMESPFFAFSNVSMPKDTTASNARMEVLIIGAHELSGRHGNICVVGEYACSVGSYLVELESEKRKVWIPATSLAPWCVFLSLWMVVLLMFQRSLLPQIGSDLGIRIGEYAGKRGQIVSHDDQNVTLRVNPTTEIVIDFFSTHLIYDKDLLFDPSIFIQMRPAEHPAIGLRVTVAGQHEYSGLHGFIYEVVDDTAPGLFRVEIDATHQLVNIKGDHLAPRQ
jgi:hypothetical protein